MLHIFPLKAWSSETQGVWRVPVRVRNVFRVTDFFSEFTLARTIGLHLKLSNFYLTTSFESAHQSSLDKGIKPFEFNCKSTTIVYHFNCSRSHVKHEQWERLKVISGCIHSSSQSSSVADENGRVLLKERKCVNNLSSRSTQQWLWYAAALNCMARFVLCAQCCAQWIYKLGILFQLILVSFFVWIFHAMKCLHTEW